MFDEKGVIVIEKDSEDYDFDMEFDDLMMVALEAGAEDLEEDDDCFEIYTAPEACSEVREALEKEGIPMSSAEVAMVPQNYVDVTDPDAVKCLQRILDLLDDDDDVQAVYHNWSE
jgi:transcriptional/translational regulatory protein YebC/TACO1